MKIKTVQENIDRCRSCFMCRHVCTLGRVTKEEALTPRSQSLSLSYILRGTFGYSPELIENIYKCCLCNYCKDWCQGGWDFPSAVRAARADIVSEGLVPEGVEKLKNEILANMNVYGVRKLNPELESEILNTPEKAKLLVVIGSDIRYAMPESGLAYLKILKKAGVDFTVLRDEDTISFELMMLGYQEEARDSAAVFAEKVFFSECRNVVVLSPDIEGFVSNEMLELDVILDNVEIIGGINYLSMLFENGKIGFKKSLNKKLTYHDCNALARITGVIEEPRRILAKIPNSEYVEMIWNKNEAHSTGSKLTGRLYPELGRQIAEKRISDIIEVSPDLVITSSVYDNKVFTDLIDDTVIVEDFYIFVEKLIRED